MRWGVLHGIPRIRAPQGGHAAAAPPDRVFLSRRDDALLNEPKTCVIVYTDGGASPNPGLGGWAAVLVSPGHGGAERELYGAEPDTTNNRMELTAAIQALRALKYPCRVELYTDSTYLRNAILNPFFND